MQALTLTPRILEACRQTAREKGLFFIRWAMANGWTLGERDPKGRLWAWCAFSASYRVWLASGGKLLLTFGKGRSMRLSRFDTGNASVPILCDDARSVGEALITQEPRPGQLVIVEVRGRYDEKHPKAGQLKPWAGRRSHIGIVVGVKYGAGGMPVGVYCHEGNLGGRDVPSFYRPLAPGANATERVLHFVDLEAYAAKLGVTFGGEAVAAPAPVGVAPAAPASETPAAPLVEVEDDAELVAAGCDVLAQVAGRGDLVHVRAIACDADGGYQAMEVDEAGQLVGPVLESHEWEPVACWGAE